MTYKCSICKDTGEVASYGILDCPAPWCTAAVDRAALEAWIKPQRLTPYDERWAVFQYAMRLCEEKIAAQTLVVGVQKRRKGDV